VLVKLTKLPIIDSAVSIGIALFMLYSSVKVAREGFDVVMDKSLERDAVEQVTAILRATASIESFHDFKTRRGKIPHVDFHVVVRPEMTTQEVHDLFLSLQSAIRVVVGPSTKVLMHADPSRARA
jgi:ferrous-iron efflux pump FieF